MWEFFSVLEVFLCGLKDDQLETWTPWHWISCTRQTPELMVVCPQLPQRPQRIPAALEPPEEEVNPRWRYPAVSLLLETAQPFPFPANSEWVSTWKRSREAQLLSKCSDFSTGCLYFFFFKQFGVVLLKTFSGMLSVSCLGLVWVFTTTNQWERTDNCGKSFN